MKTINAQGAVPTMADNYIMYRGEIDNTAGALSDGTSSIVPINTEIRQLLIVKAQCFQGTDRTPSFSDRKFDANFKVEDSSSGCKIVTIEVPSGCLCNYEISGDRGIGTLRHPEQGDGVGVADLQHAGGHRHDGNDSKKIAYANITGVPTIPTGLPFIVEAIFNFNGVPAAYGYDTNFGEDGVNFYVPNTPANLQLWYISYNTNDGAGNYNVGFLPLGATVGSDVVLSTDRFSVRFHDPGSGDILEIYKNGVSYINLLSNVPHPQFGNTTYKLIFKYTNIS